jgi:hypothetical protein
MHVDCGDVYYKTCELDTLLWAGQSSSLASESKTDAGPRLA